MPADPRPHDSRPARKPHLAILGAGPIGLEAALAAAERGHPFTLYEAAAEPAGHVRAWGHVRLFSPWDLDVSPRMAAALARAGREVPAGERCPTGHELADRLLAPLAELPEIAPRLELGSRVVAVGRDGLLKHEKIGDPERARRPFRLLLDGPGGERLASADRVLDCTGTYGNPNALGDGGIPAPGERELAASIRRHIPDFEREADDWANRRILLAGAGHSAQTAACDLARLTESAPNTRVFWALRRVTPEFSPIPDDPLTERSRLQQKAGRLAAGEAPAIEALCGVTVDTLARANGGLEVTLRSADGGHRKLAVDRVLSLTGFVGDHALYRQLQVHECYATCGPMKLAAALLGAASADCLAQESHGPDTLRNPEPGFFILGSKSYGRNSSFLMRLGFQQVDEVFDQLLG